MPLKRIVCLIIFCLSGAGVCFADANQAIQPIGGNNVSQVIPSNVRIGFVIRDFQAVVTKFMAIQSRTSGQSATPDFDPVSMFSQMLGPSFDPNGSIAAVITGHGILNDDVTDTEMAVFLPAKDSAKLSAVFNATAGADGVLQGTFPMGMGGANQQVFLQVYPGYVAISPTAKAIKELRAAGQTLDTILLPQIQNKINNSDLYFYFNTEAVAQNSMPQISQLIDSAEQKISTQLPVGSGPLKTTLDIIRLAMLQGLKDNQYSLITMRLDNQGITTDTIAQFHSGSSTAKLIEAQPPLPQNALAGLPNKDYVGVWADSINGRAVSEWLDSLLASMGPAATAQEIQTRQAIAKLLNEDLQPMANHISDAGMVLLPAVTSPSGAPMAGNPQPDQQLHIKSIMVSVPGVIYLCSSDNPAKDIGLIPSWINSTIQSMKAQNQDLDVEAKSTPAALTIDGTSLTRVDVSISDAVQAPGQPAPPHVQPIVTAVYYGAVGTNTIMIASSVDQDTLQQTVADIKSGNAGVEKRPDLAQVREQILPNAFFAAYVPLARLAGLMNGEESANQQATAMPAGALALGVPPPPVVISVAGIGTALDIAVYLPMDTLIDASKSEGTNGDNLLDLLF
ncbi:MAG TPA: hypothetical protein VMG59_10990 [Phycisphaerae bacterium]|nr:hypothetical protein [Phycisphaerae bacterium]